MSAAKEREPADNATESEASPPVAEALHAVQKAMEDLAALLGADSTATLGAIRQAGEAGRAAQDLGREKLDDLSAAVRRNPLGWLAAAAGAGLVLGLWRNRRRS
jgi:hypothetical protein